MGRAARGFKFMSILGTGGRIGAAARGVKVLQGVCEGERSARMAPKGLCRKAFGRFGDHINGVFAADMKSSGRRRIVRRIFWPK